ncbi:MAG: anthranilate synthase component I [Selenomonadaceae bacterium]|nr:anthranilate synthase component I [Selenomonadaceae bacterium]
MKIQPDVDDVERFAKDGKYDVFPVYAEILSDFITPIEAVRILKNASTHAFMLESAKSQDTWGRYTFLGFEPKLEVTLKDDVLTVGKDSFETKDPKGEIRKILDRYKSPRVLELPPFTGGLVGYFAFEFFGYNESKARVAVKDDENFRDLDLMLFDKVIAFDHVKQKIILIANIKLKNYEAEYERAKAELFRLAELLKSGVKGKDEKGKLLSEPKPMFDKETFCKMVEKGKHYIKEGDIFQIVLANSLTADFEGSLFDTYRYLRTINPSPYMFYFSGMDVEVAGASPETLVKLEDGVLHTFPLAGTRKRGKTLEEDIALEKELLADEKELAEHNMLVDLGRNDLGKISKFGTVEVEKFHSIERFSHVMHIGSTVRGEIREEFDALDAIAAVLPAGTLSGAPKIRAVELIGELEQIKRGIYGGAIGYIDFAGNMDTCIAIRIAYKKNSKVFVRSGAGIVADSVPEKEFEECLNKAKATLKAINANGGDEF